MKKIYMILSLSFGLLLRMSVLQIAYADNCYVHERGSDSWYACKEQAGEAEQQKQENKVTMRQLEAENAGASSADNQTEQTNQMLRAILVEMARQRAQ